MSLLVDRLEIGSISVFPESEEKMEKSVEANDPGPLYMYNAWAAVVSFPGHSQLTAVEKLTTQAIVRVQSSQKHSSRYDFTSNIASETISNYNEGYAPRLP